MMSLGKRIKQLREEKGLSQREMAKLLNIGSSTIGMYETDKRNPDYDTLKVFAEFFNVTTDYLLGLSTDFQSNNQDKIQTDIEGIFRQKDHGDAYLKISELADKYNLPDELVLSLIKKVREKYGPLPAPVVDSKAAHGPRYPGSGAFTKEDLEEKKDGKGNDEQTPASKPNSRRSKNKNKI